MWNVVDPRDHVRIETQVTHAFRRTEPMEIDLFEQLAQQPVPPPPESLRRDVHQRLNRLLLIMHLGELLVRGTFYAAGHWLWGVLGLVVFTASGRFPESTKQPPRSVNE